VLLVPEQTVVVERRRRALSPLAVVGGLLLAAAVGAGAGLALARSPAGIDPAEASAGTRFVTAAPLPAIPSPAAAQVQRAQSPPAPDTRVFTLAPATPSRAPSPSPSPSPSPTPSPSPSPQGPTDGLALGLSPATGPGGQEVEVSGTGWTPGTEVVLTYLDPAGADTGSKATATPDARGRFTVTLATVDPQNLPGDHVVRARSAAQEASATYEVTG
jgi:hypothetical protein